MIAGYLSESILGKAAASGRFEVRVHDMRSHGVGRHLQTDDYPFGGGQGMVLRPEPVVETLEELGVPAPGARVVLLSPGGETFRQDAARRFAGMERLVLVCGRYEGVDERVGEWVDEELSIGDYVMTGGELAALVVIDATARLLPGVLGNEASHAEESFEEGLLEFPQYTRPRDFRGRSVPEVLLSGDHGRIERWRREKAVRRTLERRPDLLAGRDLPPDLKVLVQRVAQALEAERASPGIPPSSDDRGGPPGGGPAPEE